MVNVLAQGHNAVTPVRLEFAAPRSQVKHSTTEPLHSHQRVKRQTIGEKVKLELSNRENF